ncbi:hypothetical protein L9F63_028236, partial [Diploptera punctata]
HKMALDGWTLWSYVLLLIAAIASYYLKNWFRAVVLAFQIPAGPPAVPILGNALLIADNHKLHELGRYAYKQYGLVFRAWLTVIPLAVLFSPEHIQIVLSSNKNTEKMYFYRLLHNFLGQGLITNSGSKWRYHRRLFSSQVFISVYLRASIPTFYHSAQLMVDELNARADLSAVNITFPVNDSLLNSLQEAVLGIPLNSNIGSKEISPFRQGKLVAPYRLLHPWLLLNWVYKHTDISRDELQQQQNLFQFTNKILQERRNTRGPGKHINDKKETGKPKSLLDYMIDVSEVNSKFTEADMVHELCTFMLAGQDSVGSALAFTLFELARNPEVQEKVMEEITSVFGDDTRVPNMNDLRQLKYLEQCVKEGLRLYPSVPFVLRTLTEDAKIGKIILPAGCGILVSPFATHRLPHIYPDPEKFDPDRFLPDQVEKRHPYAFLPFSAGPRNCIGHKFALMEMKTVISTILRNFILTTVPGRETVNLSYRITMRASGGIWLHLTPRFQATC